MKRVFILAYAKANVGDDLFIQMLLEKYTNTHFYINIEKEEHRKNFEKYNNITIFPEKERDLSIENAKDYDAYIYVGGSIFMEGGIVYNITEKFLSFLKECKKNNIPFFYVSSNFGPFYTQAYVNLARNVFQEITDICFRDKASYEMFKDVKSVRYAPDLAFSLDNSKVEMQKDTVGISMIDLSIRKDIINKKEEYMNLMKNCIESYVSQKKEVYLFSFCEHEGDERAIADLMQILPVNLQEHVHIVPYKANLNEFLNKYAKMEYMICTRFHAMILSSVFNQKMYVLSYSKKINNVIEDLDLLENYGEFNLIDENKIIKLDEFEIVEKEKLQKIKEDAKLQLKEVDKVLK